MSATVPIDRTDSMDDLLDWFDQQPCSCATVGHIAGKTGWSRQTVRNNLKQLRAGGYVEIRWESTGEYRLLSDPRDENPDQSAAERDREDLARLLSIPGSGEVEARRRAAVVDLLKWAEQRQEFAKSDVLDDWLTDERRAAVGYANDNTRWLKLFQQALSESEVVEYDGQNWRWVGVNNDA